VRSVSHRSAREYDEYYSERNANTEEQFYQSLVEVTGFFRGACRHGLLSRPWIRFSSNRRQAVRFVNRVTRPGCRVPDIANLRARAERLRAAQDFLMFRDIIAIHLKDAGRRVPPRPFGEGLLTLTRYSAAHLKKYKAVCRGEWSMISRIVENIKQVKHF
jgi:L-ribulose-5-phosphate 3-epimerase UlaE